MRRAATPEQSLTETAALARIRELGGRMTTQRTPDREQAEAARTMWALGDYDRFARQTVWEVGPVLVSACGIGPGQRVLDVAAGTGNVAFRAAEAGAEVIASDLTPECLAAGRRAARESGLELGWIEADAQSLPFPDAEFDAVTSAFGAIFAPDQRRVASELVRVCRPGGAIGMANFTPEGLGGEFFELVGRHAPPPPAGSLPPTLWGSEDHVRELFADRVRSVVLERRTYVERSPGGPTDYVALFQETFGPMVALRGLLADDPERLAAFDAEFTEFAERRNTGAHGGRAEYAYEYLLVVATRR